MLNRDRFVANIFCRSCWICKNIFCLFLVCLQRRWPQKLLQRTESPPPGRSRCCNGDGNVVLRDINRRNGQARADVCKNVYIVQKSCVPWRQTCCSCASVLTFSCAVLWLSRSCFSIIAAELMWDFLWKEIWMSWVPVFIVLHHLLPSGFAAANYMWIFIHFHVFNWL